MSETRTGHCLCGAVRYRLTKPVHEVDACHCDMCRRWSGSPLMAINGGTEVTFEGEDQITRYRSSQWAERAFCRACGTHLYYRLVDGGDYYLFAGTLDDQSGLTFKTQIFIDEKPDWYDFANDTKMMTGAEVFAQFAPPDAKP